MYPADFAYYRASSVQDAGRLMNEHPGAKFLAGGHSLIPLLKLRLAVPPALIDIGRIVDLSGVTVANGRLRIGALTPHAEVAASSDVATHAAALADAAGQIGDPAVRNRGTVGGNIAHADPASDLPAVLCALDASIGIVGASGDRTVPASEFFLGMMTTALGEDEIVTHVEIAAGQQHGSAYAKFPHPASRYAVIGVAAVIAADGDACRSAAVAVGGLVPAPVRASNVEQAVSGEALTDASFAKAAQRVGEDLGDEILGDLFASVEYRRAMAPVYVARSLSAAAARARK
ncbi:MAG: xanthine dehydrogenase family protein subunit M [Vicinamibacterales bacterium]|jgi:carbon-monoxide dehydrogenase medium subunit|nr:carbon monoxide dehydrogenase [Acidobacteriota bacterium]MDP7294580.1 xanthine dehydrogenase family protein subunit M [Vicinamibacterales bacterium]MDP7672578.1 xanthine dehydrogenase family protein subunit M [Vicinamibacterales bacterium]HJO39383.1 xanthine dehydrogenase family protein subunit M [Vicinamibacterales bacterium]|tara:strand:- start:111 stop:977 length:867 start_codon:yes stop_codon:yes gene_type:complete